MDSIATQGQATRPVARRQGVGISVLMSTRDRSRLLDETLAHFSRMSVDGLSWQCIVVDNGSSDGTQAVLKKWQKRLPLVPIYVDHGGKSVALNQAISCAAGEWLVFTDDDVTPCHDWLRNYLRGAERWPSYRVFGGRIVPSFPLDAPNWARRRAFFSEFAFAWYELGAEGPTSKLPFGPNFMVHRDCVRHVRFNPEVGPGSHGHGFGEETEFLSSMRERHWRPVFLPAAAVEHRIRPEQMSVDWLGERAFRFGLNSQRRKPQPLGVLAPWASRFQLRCRIFLLRRVASLFAESDRSVRARVKAAKLSGNLHGLEQQSSSCP